MEMNMNANETSTTDRWYVRCVDCLSIGAVEVNPFRQNWKCGVCAGTIEVMGKVVMDKLETETVRSACDARCTHARGPLCVCRCHCANHGTGRIVRIVVKHDIPTIEFTDADEALKIATAYRDAIAAADAALATAQRARSFYGYWKVRGLLKKAREARKHETRMKRIAEAVAMLPAPGETDETSYVPAPAPVTPTTVAITGNTYPVKDELKKLGGKWDGLRKAWIVPAANEEKARALVAAQPTKPAFQPVQTTGEERRQNELVSFSDAIPF